MTDEARFALFDGDDGSALLLSDWRRTLCFDGSGDLAALFAAIEAATATGEWVALAADYELGASFESALAADRPCQPLLRAWVYGRGERLDASGVAAFLTARLAEIPAHEKIAGVAELSPALDARTYAVAVARIHRWIVEGDCYQINLTFPLDGRLYGHPLALHARLRERQPVRYGAFITTPTATLLSLSPELFFERCGDRLLARPMKGTAARGATRQEDETNRDRLLASEKERAENIMIVDLLRNDLGRLAAPGKVRVEALCEVEAYPTLWQMVSTIAAEVPGVHLLDLFRVLFPCGSITGAPKIRAMQCIAELEQRPRGIYTGALGWVAPGGDCRFNVAIRTLAVNNDRQVSLGVGSAIVIDADPLREYAECLLKASFLTGFDPGFELIETLRLEAGEFPLLERHLARLAVSARALGFVHERQQAVAALMVEASRCAAGTYRVRLTLTHDGVCRVAATPFSADTRAWRVVLAEERLDAGDYLLRHKTTARSRYDRALAALAGQPDVFDAIFFNTRDEVCEGARSNVFVERDGVLLTPPLACGLLPGVMRQQLLASGRAVECVLSRDDLLGAPAVYMANALRGLIPVTLSPGSEVPYPEFKIRPSA